MHSNKSIDPVKICILNIPLYSKSVEKHKGNIGAHHSTNLSLFLSDVRPLLFDSHCFSVLNVMHVTQLEEKEKDVAANLIKCQNKFPTKMSDIIEAEKC